MKNSWRHETDYYYEDLELTIGFNYSPGCPAKTNCRLEDSYEGESDEVEYEIEGYENELEVVKTWYADDFMSDCAAIEYKTRKEQLPAFLEAQKAEIKKEASKLEDRIIEYLLEKGAEEYADAKVERQLSRRRDDWN